MQPTAGKTCFEYLSSYAKLSGGQIVNPTARSDCQFCALSNADQFLSSVSISYSTRWRDYGLGFAYIFFNISVAILFYYWFRVRKGSGKGFGERLAPMLKLFRKDSSAEKTTTEEKKKTPQDQGGSVLPQ